MNEYNLAEKKIRRDKLSDGLLLLEKEMVSDINSSTEGGIEEKVLAVVEYLGFV